jgi:hypothetical protein
MIRLSINAVRLTIMLAFLLPSICLADGSYHVGKDSGGMYFQTDGDGGWYIPKDDQGYFKAGEKGTYTRGTDANGTYIQIGERRKFYLDVAARGNSRSPAADTGQEKKPFYSEKETKVTIRGNRVLVPVTLGYGGKEAQVTLLLDTGASITTLSREAVKKFQISQAQKAKLIVPGGNTIDADVVQLNYIKVGPHKLPNLHAGIIDQKGPIMDYQGLLGMNFLKEVDYKIDFQRQVILWR